jgi:hypothetical protein
MKIRIFIYFFGIIYCLSACQSASLEDYRLWGLNAEFEYLLEAYRNESENKLVTLKKNAEKMGNSEADRATIRQAEELKKQTAILIGTIDSIKIYLTNGAKDVAETAKVKKLLLGAPGKLLVSRLDSFQRFLTNDFKNLGLKKADFKEILNNQENFIQTNFSNANLVEALTILTEKQLQIVENEQLILQKMTKEVPETYIHFVNAKNNHPKSGDWYEAEVVLMRFFEQKYPVKMKVNGQNIAVDKYGIGKIKIKPTGLGEQTLKAEATFRNRGRDTTFTLEKKYFVVPK